MSSASPLFLAAIDAIDASNRLRPTDPDRVAALAASIAEIGLQQPIVVRSHPEGGNRLQLVAGAHRYEGALKLGWTEIAAIWLDIDEAHARIIEIDENLIRNELSALDFAISVAERKRLYEAMYPGTAWGKASKPKRGDDEGKELNLSSFPSFAKDAAKRTGLSATTFKRAATLMKELAPAAIDLLRASPLADNGAALRKLSKLPAEKQLAAAKQLAAGAASTIDSALAAAGFIPPPVKTDPDQQLMARWAETLSRTNATQRRALLLELLRNVRTGEAAALANVLAEKLPHTRQKIIVKALAEAIEAHETP